MADTTIYPYGTNGQLPSSIGIIDDLTTGGRDKALSAEMGKELNNKFKSVDVEDADLMVADEQGNVLVSLDGGHIKTKDFDSRQVGTNAANIQQLQSQIGQGGGTAQADIVVKEDEDAAFDVSDPAGNVVLRVGKDGHIKTKGFDSGNMDIFRATKLDSPQCICHGYGSVSAQANTIGYFRAGYAAGYRFFECDAINCTDGIPVCTHQYNTITVYAKDTHEATTVAMQQVNGVWTIQMDSDELVEGYTWDSAGNVPIALLSEVIWQVCYFYRCPLHVDGQGLNKASCYAASQYAESLGVGQYVFHELPTGIYADWDIPCNAIVYINNRNIQTLISSNKKADNNIIFYLAQTASESDIKSAANAAHAGGCYLMSWTFSSAASARAWFANGADFIITSNSITNDKI